MSPFLRITNYVSKELTLEFLANENLCNHQITGEGGE